MPEYDPKRDDPAAHQPTTAEMNEPVKIDANLDQLRAAMVRGGADRQTNEPRQD